MQLKANAKINWSLDITGIRPDGYHLMDMLMQPIELHDTITLTPAEDLTLVTSGSPLLKADEKHLAMRAARLLKEYTGTQRGASISVFKRIPVGAGLGGGSADAAAVLYGLNQLWGTDLSQTELENLGLRLGADIPFCLRGGLTRTRGIGEDMENLPCGRLFPLVVIQPCRGLSTREVFGAFRFSPALVHPDTETSVHSLAAGDLLPLRKSLGNVLQPVSVEMQPEIGRCIRKLKESGAEIALMTGSGSAVFGVFRSREKARAAFSSMALIWPRSFLTRSGIPCLEIVNSSES